MCSSDLLGEIIQKLSEFPLDNMTLEAAGLVFRCHGAVESYADVYSFSADGIDYLSVDEADPHNPFWIRMVGDMGYNGSWCRNWDMLLAWYRLRC